MKLTIHGPNLNDQSKGTFHVHTARCRDNKHEISTNGSVEPMTLDVDSLMDVVDAIYPAEQFEDRDEHIDTYIADFNVEPCVTNLPLRPDPKPSGPISAADVEIGATYAVKLKSRIAHVRIDSVNDDGGWNATTLDTKRTITISDPVRLRREITPESSEQLAAHVNGDDAPVEPAKPAAAPAAKRGPLQLPSGVTPRKVVLDFLKARATNDVDAGGQARPFITHTGKVVIHAKWLRDYLAETIDPNVTVSQAVTMLRDLGYADRSVAVVGAATKNLSVWMADAPSGSGSIPRMSAPERKSAAKPEATS